MHREISEEIRMEERKTDAAREQTVKRLYKLLELQNEIEQKFGSDRYNVFVFGSYITVNFVEGVSDVDVAIYTDDFQLYKKISLYIEEFFEKMNIGSDIFFIDLNMVAPVYLAPLNSKVQFTEFYPKCLEEFRNACQNALNQTKMRMMS